MTSALPAFEKYLNIRSAYAPSFSPDGRRLAFLTNITGLPQLWIVDASGGWPEQLTFGADRVMQADFSPTQDRLIISRDVDGSEKLQLYLLNSDGSGEKRLTHDDQARHLFGGWAPDGRRIAFSSNQRNPGCYDLYLLDVETGAARMIWQNDKPGSFGANGFSLDGARVLVFFGHANMHHDLYQVTLENGAVRYLTPHSGQARYSQPTFSADGQAVYCLCDLEREFPGVVRINLADLSVAPVAQPEAEVEFLAVSRDGRFLCWVANVDGAHTLDALDLHTGKIRHASHLPVGVVGAPDSIAPVFSPTRGQVAFSFSTPRCAPDVWVWDLETDDLWQVTRSSHGGIPSTCFIEPELIRYPTFDGREITAWFYRPQVHPPWAVVVYVHGGPQSQAQPLMYPILQYLVVKGYAVLAPNVRGSAGYGKTFAHLDDVEKRMDSVTDLAHGVYWLCQQPEIAPGRIAIYGGSYGGFMVLAALTTFPDLWAAGVDFVGISNFVTFLENTGAYRRANREAEYGSLKRDRELLERISPINSVDKIQTPLMVVHGANDPRVPLEEAEQIVNAVRARNVPVEFLVYPDEGHRMVKLANKLDVYPKMAAFLDRYLSGGAPHP